MICEKLNTHSPDASVREHAVADGGHGMLSHSEVEVAAARHVALETHGAALIAGNSGYDIEWRKLRIAQ